MTADNSSSSFTKTPLGDSPFGPPLIGALLRAPSELVRRHMLDRLHAAGFADLEPAHLSVLQYPGPQGKKPSELAAELRVSKQALNYLLGQLERLGYLRREPDPHDRRSRRVVLTEHGRATVPVIRSAVAEVEADWAERLGVARFAALRELLVDLNRVIG
jgi:DNA-binding MarR family transcriptional regulator